MSADATRRASIEPVLDSVPEGSVPPVPPEEEEFELPKAGGLVVCYFVPIVHALLTSVCFAGPGELEEYLLYGSCCPVSRTHACTHGVLLRLALRKGNKRRKFPGVSVSSPAHRITSHMLMHNVGHKRKGRACVGKASG
jgi:hypothetical protein